MQRHFEVINQQNEKIKSGVVTYMSNHSDFPEYRYGIILDPEGYRFRFNLRTADENVREGSNVTFRVLFAERKSMIGEAENVQVQS